MKNEKMKTKKEQNRSTVKTEIGIRNQKRWKNKSIIWNKINIPAMENETRNVKCWFQVDVCRRLKR